MKLVLGLVGEKRGGKGTFVTEFMRLAPPNSCVHYRFSDPLVETLKIWEPLSISRENLQKLSIAMKETFGNGTLMRTVEARVRNASAPIVILDGIRWFEDESLVRNFPINYLIYVTTLPRIRYERSLLSSEKAGESSATYEEFWAAEQVETEIHIPDIGSRANIRIDNNGTPKQFLAKIKKVYKALTPLIETKS